MGRARGLAISAVVVIGVAASIVWRSDALVVPVAVAVGVIVLLVAVGVLTVVESRRLAYQLRERDLSLRSGAFRHRVETIPFSRIQHVSVGRGVLERSLGLATLQVSSAGPDFSVPGLSPSDAELIKAAIAERAALESEIDDGSDVVRDVRGHPAALTRTDLANRSRTRIGTVNATRVVAAAVIDLSEPQRQSPFAIVMIGIRVVRSLGIAQLLVAIAVIVRWAADGRLLFAIVVVGAVFLAVSALSWWRYTFQFVDSELVVTSGVLRADRLTVPVGRIQSVAVEQELLHRLTGLVKVVIDTAGSSQAEFTIDAVARPVADELQRRVGTTRPGGASVDVAANEQHDPEERIVFQHDTRRLIVTALTMSPWAGLALLVPLFALSQEALEPIVDRLTDAAPEVSAESFGWWSVPPIVVAALAFVVLLNLGRVFLTDWQLALRTDATTVRRTAGLLSRTSHASTRNRVQVMTSRQNPLQRRVGLRDIHLSNAGSGDLRFGGCRDDEVGATAALVGLTPLDALAPDRRVHPALVWLRVRNTSVAAVVIVGVVAPFVGWWALVALLVVALLVVVPVWWSTHRHVGTHRWSLGPELITSSHVLVSSTEQLLLRKTNSVQVTQSLFERRRGLGRVHVATAAGTVTIGMIPIDEARTVRDVILYGVETDRRSWM